MLHTLSHSPYQIDFSLLINMITIGDTLLCLQDGVTALVKNSHYSQRLQQSGAMLFVLDADLQARGLHHLIIENVSIITYEGFVELTEKNERQMNW